MRVGQERRGESKKAGGEAKRVGGEWGREEEEDKVEKRSGEERKRVKRGVQGADMRAENGKERNKDSRKKWGGGGRRGETEGQQ